MNFKMSLQTNNKSDLIKKKEIQLKVHFLKENVIKRWLIKDGAVVKYSHLYWYELAL